MLQKIAKLYDEHQFKSIKIRKKERILNKLNYYDFKIFR
jgi:hypothetical protein